MNIYDKMESINALHKNTEQIVQEMKENLNGFLEETSLMRNRVYQRMKNGAHSLDEIRQIEMEMDSFITHLSLTSILATQFHMNLRFRRTTNSIVSYGRANLLPSNAGLSHLRILESDWPNTYPFLTPSAIINGGAHSEYNFKSTNEHTSQTSILSYDLAEFQVGQLFRAKITSIKDRQHNIFYVSKMTNIKVEELNFMKNLPELAQIPSAGGVIFGISIGQKIHRAIRHDAQFIFLIDCGSMVSLEDSNALYSLPAEFVNIPAQAILCQLVGVVDREKHDRNFDLQQVLYTLESKVALFLVEAVQDSKLLVEILSTTTEEQQELEQEQMKKATEEEPYNIQANPFSDTSTSDINNNTRTNTNTHKSEVDDIEKMSKEIIVKQNKKEELIKIFVTHITGIVKFYGQMPNDTNNHHENITLCWRDEEICPKDILNDTPDVGELVLARFKADGLWYRAQVRAVNNDDLLLTVFFVDFGNEETVRLHSVASMPNNMKKKAARAKHFTLSNIEDVTLNDRELHKRAMQTLSILLLNEEIRVTVVGVNANDDIIIDFVDEDFIKIKNNMINMNFVKVSAKI